MPEVAGFEDDILGVGSLTRNISGDRGVYPVRHHTKRTRIEESDESRPLGIIGGTVDSLYGGRCRRAATRCGVVNLQPNEKLVTPPHELEVLK